MDRREFWNIIEESGKKAKGDPDMQMDTLRDQLQAITPEELVEFQAHFDDCWCRANHWDLWAAAYIIGGGCSDDGFMDFRGWLISKGEKVFEAALKNADSLVDVMQEPDGEGQIEGFQYIAPQVWAEKTGKEIIDHFPYTKTHPGEPEGEEWSEEGDDLSRRFPKLWKKYGDENF
jgi:hypothetical protein